MKYQKITKDNFEEFTEKYVSGGWDKIFTGLEMPKNISEFKQFTKAIYGVELNVECFAYPKNSFSRYEYSCNYKIIGKSESEYSENPIMKLWNKKYGQYDGLKVFLNTCFGRLTCGGVANSHYGQTECNKETWERIKNWDNENSNKYIKSSVDTHRSLVDIFGVNLFTEAR